MAQSDPEPLGAGSDRRGSPVTGEYMGMARDPTRTTNPTLGKRLGVSPIPRKPLWTKGFKGSTVGRLAR